jgi:hypothetical protein
VTAKVRVVDVEPGTPRGTSLADRTAHRLVIAAPGRSADRYRQAGGSQVGVTLGCGVLFPPLSLNPRNVQDDSARSRWQGRLSALPGPHRNGDCTIRRESPGVIGDSHDLASTNRGLRLRGGKRTPHPRVTPTWDPPACRYLSADPPGAATTSLCAVLSARLVPRGVPGSTSTTRTLAVTGLDPFE